MDIIWKGIFIGELERQKVNTCVWGRSGSFLVENKDECDPAIYRILRSNICASGSKYSCPAHISSVSPSKYGNNRKSKASVFLSFARECRVLCTWETLKYFIRFLACIFTSMAAGQYTSTGEDVCQRERERRTEGE